MPSLLERAARWQKQKLDISTSVLVTVHDGAEAIEDVKAVPGQSNFLAYTLDEATGTAKTFDWLVSAEDLYFDGVKREPHTGWEIWYRLQDGRSLVYLVVAEAGTRCFDVMDQLSVLLRIHTKLDRIEAA